MRQKARSIGSDQPEGNCHLMPTGQHTFSERVNLDSRIGDLVLTEESQLPRSASGDYL
jgi:hypothetical protein